MGPSYDPEKTIKPFKLVKYFTFTSLVVILIGAIALSMLISRRAETVLIKKSEDYAVLMAENLNHQVFLQFVIPATLQVGQVIRLRDEALFHRLDQIVRNTLHSFNVKTVNILDREDNVIFYSFDKRLVGKHGMGGMDYQQALQGISSSRLIRRGSFWGMLINAPNESELRTYVSLRAERPLSNMGGPVLGVFEIVQDLSSDYKTIVDFNYRVMAISAAIMGILFIVLRQTVKRGEEIIEKRAEERLLLKEKLSESERLASLGQMVATVSNEVRTPLGIITSTAELLKKKIGQAESKPTHEIQTDAQPYDQLADVIIKQACHLDKVVADFLRDVKLENRKKDEQQL